tara:strand:+ start:31825 stop:32079 length:255 start_codon:yes stop_codon:yes gene_type:complete
MFQKTYMSIKYEKIHSPCFLLNFLAYECTLIDPLLLDSAPTLGYLSAWSPDNSYTVEVLSVAARTVIPERNNCPPIISYNFTHR